MADENQPGAAVGGEPGLGQGDQAERNSKGRVGQPAVPAAEDYAPLPEEMRTARRWLLWKLESAGPDKKPRKVPYYANGSPRRGELDSPADVANFASFEDALNRLQTGRYSGLGFALGPDGTGHCWQGVDLDDLPSRPALRYLADDLPGYTETSPSGSGTHAIGYGRPFDTLGSNKTGIEAYAAGRFFTVTADRASIHPPVCLADFVENRLAPLHRARGDAPSPAGDRVQCVTVLPQTAAELRSALNAIRSDDRAEWVRIGHALKTLGDVGRGLWLDWSQTSKAYDPADAARVWDSLQPVKIDHRAVFSAAQSNGWVNPRSNSGVDAREAFSQVGNFGFVRARDLLSKPKPIRWLIRGLFEQGALAQLFGASTSGKSFMAIDWGWGSPAKDLGDISPGRASGSPALGWLTSRARARLHARESTALIAGLREVIR